MLPEYSINRYCSLLHLDNLGQEWNISKSKDHCFVLSPVQTRKVQLIRSIYFGTKPFDIGQLHTYSMIKNNSIITGSNSG
jgi:hypothetical protein